MWLLSFPMAHAYSANHAYGEDFVRVGSSWRDAGPPTMDRPLTSPRSMSEFERRLEEAQDRYGPYGDALAEPLTGLARGYLASGDLEQATRHYRRALHIVRINDGLYSKRQIPILQQLLGIYRSTGDLESLDQRYDYYFRLYGSGQPPFTEVRIGAALGYFRWQREALRLGMDGERHQRLLNLYRLNDELIQAVAGDRSVTAAQFNEVVLSQLRNLYLLEDRIQPRLEKMGVVETAPAFGGEWEQTDFERKRLETLQRGALSIGANLVDAAIERSAGAVTPEELAKLHLELGDWYQWHGSERADAQYKRVVEILSSAGQDALLQRWLGQPVELPDNGAFWQPPPQTGGEPPLVIETRYDVSAEGRVSNLSASSDTAGAEAKASRLQRNLRKTRFRPRWVNGGPEAVTGVERAYQWRR
jgi:tetratricopeptide (TPR) repeat protein